MLKAVTSKTPRKSNDLGILLIGIFKLLKAAMLLTAGIGLLRLLHRDVSAVAMRWVERLRLDPDNEHIHRALARALRVTPRQLKELSAGTFIYAGLYFTEGIGLTLRKRWAEYFTTISTALFIPLEIYEMFKRFTWIRVALLGVNLAIVWYLVLQIRRRR